MSLIEVASATMGRVEIRLLNEDDIELMARAVELFRRVVGVDHQPFLSDPSTLVLVAFEDEEIVGWAWGTRQRHACGFSQVQLYEIETVAEHRGQGVGRALLTELLRLVNQEEHQRMRMLVDGANEAAQALYRSTGGRKASGQPVSFWWQRPGT